MSILLVLAAAVATPQPGELKTFRDWIVGCDNGRACKAVGLMPGDVLARDDFLRLAVSRENRIGGQAILTVDFDTIKPGTRIALMLDGRLFAETVGAPSESETRLILTTAQVRALANGTTASVGKATASLGGMSAAMRYIDDQQHSAGTADALIAIGQAKAGWEWFVYPIVREPSLDKRPPRMLKVARVTQLIGPDVAKCDYTSAKVEPEVYRLDAQTSLVTVVHPCGNGAYNYYSSAFLIDEAGKVRPATFDTDKPNPKDGENLGLVNAGYDPKTRRLSSFMKGRGLGDCGSGQDYVWDGTRFRLVEQTDMGECRGSMDYIRTWRAVVR